MYTKELTIVLTFENNAEEEQLEVHADIQRLKYLRSEIDSLIEQSQKAGNEHIHLMTEEWGGEGSGLTSEKQHPDNQLFKHVKLFCWHKK